MARITTLGVVTADRPAILRRSLESFVRHCDAHGQRPRFLVIDGSRQPENRTATQSTASAVRAASGHDVEYIGKAEASRFCAALGPNDEVAQMLAPGSIGANRNLMLLLTAGEQILSIDDDIVCETWALPGREDTLAAMGHRQELLETGFFSSRAEVFASIERTPADLLAAHGDLLGQSLPALVAASPQPPDLTHSCGHLRVAVREGRPFVVKATFAGLAGDAATYCPYRLLFSSGPLRSRLWASQRSFATALTSREAFRIAETVVVTHDSACMAGCMGLSNQAVAPPFMPAGGNEDGVFGAMLAACDPATLFAHLPIGVVHDSDRSAERGVRMLSATESRVSDLIVGFVSRRPSWSVAASPDARMQRLSRLLMDYADLDTHAFVDLVRDVTLDARSREFAVAEQAVDDPECPDFWRDAVDQYRDEFHRNMTKPDFFLPVEFHGNGPIESGYCALQAFVRTFGQLIALWPALWDTARRLNRGG